MFTEYNKDTLQFSNILNERFSSNKYCIIIGDIRSLFSGYPENLINS